MSEETKLNDAEYIREMINTLIGDYIPQIQRHNERLEAIAKKLETMDAKPSSPVDIKNLAIEITSEVDTLIHNYYAGVGARDIEKLIHSALLKADFERIKRTKYLCDGVEIREMTCRSCGNAESVGETGHCAKCISERIKENA